MDGGLQFECSQGANGKFACMGVIMYSGCQKNVPIAERFFCDNTYAAILFSEH
jgi:hypothetical protein